MDVRVFPHSEDDHEARARHAEDLSGLCRRRRQDLPDADEAQELRAQGVDVVVGYFEPHGRQDTIAKTEGLEMIPRRIITYAGPIRGDGHRRHPAAPPAVAVVDEFAHTNVPGCRPQALGGRARPARRRHRRADDDERPAPGEPERPVWQITGVRVRETVPDWVVKQADEVVMVDLTPRALLNRLERGVVYAPEKARRALENFFTEANLTALRELAMRHTAHEVEEKLAAPRREERILICLTAPASAMLIRRGKRVADYLQADCLAVHVARSRR